MARQSETLTIHMRESDVFKRVDNPEYSYGSFKIINPKAAEVTYPIGTPLSVNESTRVATPLLSAAVDPSVQAFLCERVRIAASTTTVQQYRVIQRGPAIVNEDNMPLLDYNGETFVQAEFKSMAAAMDPPIIFRGEPAQQESISS